MMTGVTQDQPRPAQAASAAGKTPLTVLFGVGAPKCGTSWLHGYLRRHPDCAMRHFKELNYINTVSSGSYDRRIEMMKRKAQIIAAERRTQADAERRAMLDAQAADLEEAVALMSRRADDPVAYLAYLTGPRRDEALVADLSPAYAMLAPAGLARLLATAPDCRVLFLMRDPVERLWSHVRMNAQLSLPPGEPLERHTLRWLDMVLSGREPGRPGVLSYSDYAAIVTRLRAAIPAGRLCVMFTEDLLAGDGAERLCGFLGIRPLPADSARRANRGQPVAQPQAVRAAMRRALRPQYEFAARSFPALPESWQRSMAEGFA
jgi:hypothetical protein